MFRVAVFAVAVLPVFGCISNERLDVDDPEIELVREWIAENSDSGTWEEIRWYPPLGETAKLVRMKYRTRSPDGGKVLCDRVFWVQDGKLIPEDNIYRIKWEE